MIGTAVATRVRRTASCAARAAWASGRDSSRRALLAVAVVAMLFGASRAARSGPCTTEIDQLEQEIASDAPAPNSGPTAAQSVGAQLHHQPSPGSVGQAAHVANADGDAAIERAKKADAAGDATGCKQAVVEARRLYNIGR